MKYYVFIALALLFSSKGTAQISERAYPLSFVYANLKTTDQIETVKMPSFDVQKLIEEDKITDLDKSIPPRFGYAFETDLNLKNYGTYEQLENGWGVWRLKIKSENAISLNLQFKNFNLADGAKLFIYDQYKRQLLGAFTQQNNKKNGVFATSIIASDEVILELNEPLTAIGNSHFILSKAVHGYRNLKNPRDFGTSGSCNVNVACPDADQWRDDIRASAMILLANGTRWCSGSLINNVNQDNTPYFLTANHCIVNFFGNFEDVSNWVYIFNYESPDCAGTLDGSLLQSVQGSSIISTLEASDFALLLLDDVPPLDYNVYYSGWNADSLAQDSVVGIHHPNGDVKKICFDYDSVESSGYFAVGNTHWEVLDWDLGTTEPGSSGSPLFDKNHHIIGQLHGGSANCTNDLEDYYGKLSYSWDKGIVPEERLKDWLDPDTTNVLVLDGIDFNFPTDSFNVNLKNIQVPKEICGNTIEPIFTIQNYGGKDLISATIKYQIDSVIIDSFLWTGLLKFKEYELITLPPITVKDGAHTIKIISTNPNDTLDEKTNNDTILSTFFVQNGIKAKFSLLSDNLGFETRTRILNEENQFIYFMSSYPNNELRVKDMCLVDDCYKILITDKGDNGICCSNGQGYYQLTIKDSLVAQGGEFTDSAKINFCINEGQYNSISSEKEQINKITIYPNPSKGIFNIQTYQTPTEIFVYDVLGKLIYNSQIRNNTFELNLTSFEQGIYILKIQTKNNSTSHKIILKHE